MDSPDYAWASTAGGEVLAYAYQKADKPDTQVRLDATHERRLRATPPYPTVFSYRNGMVDYDFFVGLA